jgi:hypothetical protein
MSCRCSLAWSDRHLGGGSIRRHQRTRELVRFTNKYRYQYTGMLQRYTLNKLLQKSNQCCGSESKSERIRRFWADPNPKKSSDSDTDPRYCYKIKNNLEKSEVKSTKRTKCMFFCSLDFCFTGSRIHMNAMRATL